MKIYLDMFLLCSSLSETDMDWDRAIAINQAALTRIVAALIALIGLTAGEALARLPRPVYRAALGVLRPAESAVRRLIVIAARGVSVKPHAARPMPAGLALSGSGAARASFQLFDARKRFAPARPRSACPKAEPRNFVFGGGPLVPLFQPRLGSGAEPKLDDGKVSAERLARRLWALKTALENLPRQVKRPCALASAARQDGNSQVHLAAPSGPAARPS
jgi:hypothetical protein